MTLYARSDLCSTAVPRSHGGCGERHDRPVEKGAPVKLWKLSCPQCESELRDSPHWAATISEIPETHDERIQREDEEKRGIRERDQASAKALELLGDLPAALKQLTGGSAQTVYVERCPSGHTVLSGSKFCGECGASMGVPAADSPPPAPADAPPAEVSDAPSAAVLEAMTLPELREIAVKYGIRNARSKADQVNLITEYFGSGAAGE